jgi:secreted trypsin-like serine protease
MALTFLLRLFFIQVGFSAVASITYSCSSNATCGCSLNSAVLTKIVGGEQAETDTWGWAVSIRVSNSHICGGSVISSTYILTAAHCLASLKSISTLSVNAGSTYLSVIRQQRSASQIYIHQNYDAKTFVNDIAVIGLSSPLNMNDRSIARICLPLSTSTDYPPANATVIAIGWGVLSTGSKVTSNILEQVTLQVISKTAVNCQKSVYNANVQFCAGVQGGGKGILKNEIFIERGNSLFFVDTCQGDSGGPLMMFSNGHWELVGITSYGIGCALAAYPGIYTRVSSYKDWTSCFLSNNTSCIKNTIFKQVSFVSTGSSIVFQTSLPIFLYLVILELRT